MQVAVHFHQINDESSVKFMVFKTVHR